MTRAATFVVGLMLVPAVPAARQATFTAEDMLKVVTASVIDVSEDGRFAVITERRPLDNATTDHARYGDPTYLGPSAVRVVTLALDTGARRLPFGDRLVNLRQAAWSRDGRRLALLLADTSGAAPVLSLHVWDEAAGRLAAVPEPAAGRVASNSGLEWTPDGRRVVVSLRDPARDADAARRFQAVTAGPIVVHSSKEPFLEWDELNRSNRWRSVAEIDVQTGAATVRVAERRVSTYQVTRDGRTVVFQEDVTEKTDYEAIGGTENRLLASTEGGAEPAVLVAAKDLKGLTLRWSDDGRAFAYAKQGEVFVRGIGEAEARSVTPRPKAPAAAAAATTPDERPETDTAESFSVTSFSRDGSRLLVTSRRGWYVVTIADATRRQILTLDPDDELAPRLAAIDWSPDGAAIYATWSARDRWERGIVRLDAGTGAMTTVVKDARRWTDVRLTRDGRRFVGQVSDGDRPAEVFVADAGSGGVRELTRLNPWLDARRLPKSELVAYRDVDGKVLYGVLRYPVDHQPGRRYPTVFEIYETFFDNGFNARAAFLTNHGYAVFHPSVNLVVGRPGEAWVKGVTTAANRLIEMGVADPDRLGVHGTSYGGYATVLLLTQTDRFKAAINVSGKVNMVSFYTDSPRLGVRNTHAPERSQDRLGGTLWDYPERYLEHSAVLQADRIRTPLLCITGDLDPNVPASQSREIYYALRRLGREVEWVRYVTGGHRPPNSVDEAIDFETRILNWYDKHLKKEPAAPAAGGRR